jgi:hypothetical protein
MQLCLLRRCPNSLVVRFMTINVILIHLGCRSNGYTFSNGYIASPWKNSMWRCSVIPTKFKFWNPSFCEVPSGTFCNFLNFPLFLLSFISFHVGDMHLIIPLSILISVFFWHSNYALLRFFHRIQGKYFYSLWGRYSTRL